MDGGFLSDTNRNGCRPVSTANHADGRAEITIRFRGGFLSAGAVTTGTIAHADFIPRQIGCDRVLHRRHVCRENKFTLTKFALIHFFRFVFCHRQGVFRSAHGMRKWETIADFRIREMDARKVSEPRTMVRLMDVIS